MMDMGLAPFVGGTVITKKAWKKLSAADQAAVLAACKRAEASLGVDVPEQERQAIAEMRKRGLTLVELRGERSDWQKLADQFAKQMGPAEVPKDIFDEVGKRRREFREGRGTEGPG